MSIPLTKHMQRFRLASRDLWNHYFLPTVASWPPSDEQCYFAAVEESLFLNMVLYPVGLPEARYRDLNTMIRVVIESDYGVPAMINRGVDSGYWDHPICRLGKEADLRFVSYFDWNEFEVIDHQYVRVQIHGHPDPSLVGKHALVEFQYATFAVA